MVRPEMTPRELFKVFEFDGQDKQEKFVPYFTKLQPTLRIRCILGGLYKSNND